MDETRFHPESAGDARVDETKPEPPAWSMRWQVPLLLAAVAAWGVFLWTTLQEKPAPADPGRAAAARIRGTFERGDYERVERDAGIFASRYAGHALGGEMAMLAARAAFERGEREIANPRACYERACASARRALSLRLTDESAASACEVLALSTMRLGDDREGLRVLADLRRRDPAAGLRLGLVQAEAEFRTGDLAAGRATVDRVFNGPRQPADREAATWLTLAEGLRINGRLDEAEPIYRRVIDSYPNSARVKDANYGMGLLLRVRTPRRPELLDAARRRFETAATLRFIGDEALTRKAAFYVGECLADMNDPDAAAEAFRRVTASWSGTPEGVAASLRLASLSVTRGQFDAAREALGGALAQLPQNGLVANSYVTPAEINALWGSVMRHFLTAGDYDELSGLNRDAQKLAHPDVYAVRQASLLREHAGTLRAEAARLARAGRMEDAREREEEARFNHRRAAALLVPVVHGVEGDPGVYSKALAMAADSFFAAGAHAEAAVYYRLVLRGSRDDASAHLRLGQALEALGRHAEAAAELDACLIGDRRTPAWYEAMLARANCRRAAGDWAGAERAYAEIVGRPDLFNPAGRQWREALCEMGYVLYRGGKFREAVVKIDEALERPGVVEGLSETRFTRAELTYYLADAWRSIGSGDPSARRGELAAAADRFAAVRAAAETRAPSELEATLRRRSLIAEADCRFELADYRAALALYRRTAEKYLDRAEGVGALYGAAACLDRLDERTAAGETLKRAKWCHRRLKEEHANELNSFLEGQWNATASWRIAAHDE